MSRTRVATGAARAVARLAKQVEMAIGPHDLVVFPGNSQIIYAAASAPSGGILKSTDGGATWAYLGTAPFNNATLTSVVVNLGDGDDSAQRCSFVCVGVLRAAARRGARQPCSSAVSRRQA